MPKIESEFKFVWRQILHFLKLPLLFILVLLGKKEKKILIKPIRELWIFIFQPISTISLIITNIIIFALEIFYLDQKTLESLVFRPEHILNFTFANFKPIIASWFLHANIAHLAGNMLFLFIFGRIVEMKFGSLRTLLIYFGSAIISSCFSAGFNEGGIGASGAIAGLIGVAILTSPFYLTHLLIGILLPIILVGWLAIFADITGILQKTNDNIGHFAHLGGYLAITIIVFLFKKKDRDKFRLGLIINFVFVASIMMFLYAASK